MAMIRNLSVLLTPKIKRLRKTKRKLKTKMLRMTKKKEEKAIEKEKKTQPDEPDRFLDEISKTKPENTGNDSNLNSPRNNPNKVAKPNSATSITIP